MKRLYPYLFILSFCSLLLPQLLHAQTDEYDDLHQQYDLEFRTFRFALVPGLSTNGVEAPSYASKYSWNILAGYNGALDRGFELGGLLNINKYYAHGGQIAGLGNYSGEETAGIQLAGIFNWSGDEMQGIQISGITNVSKREMQGIQLTGVANIADGTAQGIQISGVINYAKDDMQGMFLSGLGNYAEGNMQGIQLSGLFNYANWDIQGIAAAGLVNYSDTFQGMAFAPINIAKYGQGIQAGNINIADEMQGIQLGIVNYAKDMEGVPVGLISYYENGRTNIDVWTSDAGFTNFGIKLGTPEVYNMISIGFNPALNRDVWQVGWSIGRLHEYETHFLYTDFSIYKINEKKWTKDLNSLFKYRILFGKELFNGMDIYGGPTINMLISRVDGSSDYSWYRIHDFGAKGRTYTFWIGYALGFELF